jgi:hypothetical protein
MTPVPLRLPLAQTPLGIADDPESPWAIRGDLFGYVAGLLSTIGCLEGHSVKPVEVAAMREVCRVRGWEIPSEFSLNPPNRAPQIPENPRNMCLYTVPPEVSDPLPTPLHRTPLTGGAP